MSNELYSRQSQNSFLYEIRFTITMKLINSTAGLVLASALRDSKRAQSLPYSPITLVNLDQCHSILQQSNNTSTMICHRCLRCLPSRPSSTRTLSTLPYLRSPSTVSSSPTHSTPRPATSTSAAQPFSTPFTPSVPPLPTPASDDGLKIRSSVPAGTRLTGLGYLKNKEVPVAKEDGEYPAWLWGLLERGGKDGEKGMDGGDVEEGDMFCEF